MFVGNKLLGFCWCGYNWLGVVMWVLIVVIYDVVLLILLVC